MKRLALYQKKDRQKLIISKIIIGLLIIGAGILSAHVNKLTLPTIEEKLSWGVGLGAVIFVVILAMFNRIKILIRIKSLGFVIAFIILSLLRVGIDTLITTIGLISIPLLIDDLIIENYFKFIDIKKYGIWENRN